jgi:signal transduction histidine kinase
MWAAFGVIWDLRMFGLVGLQVEEVVNLCCDFSAKVRAGEWQACADGFASADAGQVSSQLPHMPAWVVWGGVGRVVGDVFLTSHCTARLYVSRIQRLCQAFVDAMWAHAAYARRDRHYWPQVVFSCGLMLSSFKGMDSRREGVMRQIQESHRQTLIQELKRVIEQKDAFMSSVSHELRTPLNGIIGAAMLRPWWLRASCLCVG